MISIWTDITFIHEGNKTFLDNLVNFDKLVSEQVDCIDVHIVFY